MRQHPFLAYCSRCSRKHFVVAGGAAVAGALLAGCGGGGGSILPSDPSASQLAKHSGLEPVPIPANPALGGLSLQIPGAAGDEISLIYDFNGDVGRGLGGGGGTGNGTALFWHADFGFMDGEYRSVTGQLAHGTFVFV